MKSGKSRSSKTKSKKRKTKQNPPPVSFLECHSLACVAGILPRKASISETSTVNSLFTVPQVSLVNTPVASNIVKELFFERFEREIVLPYSLRHDGSKRRYHEKASLYVQKLINKRQKLENPNPSDNIFQDRERRRRIHCKRRLLMGTNQCARHLGRIQQQQERETNKVARIEQKELLAETRHDDAHAARLPALMVLARDIYPPTMLSQAPIWAHALNIPLLLLPGQASSELGQAVGTKKTSILLFLPRFSSSSTAATSSSAETDSTYGEDDDAIDSFIEYVKTQVPKQS